MKRTLSSESESDVTIDVVGNKKITKNEEKDGMADHLLCAICSEIMHDSIRY
jgi:hypothetical protein